MSRLVFDISEHNGSNLDFDSIAEHGIGLIIRAGFGAQNGRLDYEFQDNVAKAEARGIDYGVYWYSYAENADQAYVEACRLGSCANDYCGSHLVYPLFFDVEEPGLENVSRETCDVFAQTMRMNGHKYGIYASYSWWMNYIPNMLDDPDCVRWVAYWSDEQPLIDRWDIWQFGAYNWQGRQIDGNLSDYVIPMIENRSLESLALDVLEGKYGILCERIEKLGDRYAETQNYINECYIKANDVLRGKYGNGDERKRLLGKDYPCVQYIVDSFLRGDYS